jgi:hypothetical protein
VLAIAQKENLGLTLACAWPWSQNISSQFRLDTPKQAMSRERVDLIELELARIALYGAVPNRTVDPNAYLVDPVAQACEPLPEQVLQQWGYTIDEPVVAVIERGTCLDTVKVSHKSRVGGLLRDAPLAHRLSTVSAVLLTHSVCPTSHPLCPACVRAEKGAAPPHAETPDAGGWLHRRWRTQWLRVRWRCC